MIEYTVRVGAGGKLRVREDADPKGHPVFVLHGTPGSRILYGPHVVDAAQRGLRLISHDRPGYGGSTPRPGRRVADAAADVAAIADSLGIERFGVWGHSGGGAPALACAALLDKRVVGASCLSGVAPYPAEGLDWLAGTGELNVDDFQLMLRDRTSWELKSRRDRAEMLGWNEEQLREGFASLCSDVDRKVLTDEFTSFLLAQGREGLRPGDDGMRDDSLSTVKPWGFDLAKIRPPVQVWHGGQDRFVPITHGQWLAARIPNVDAHLERDQGHLTVFLTRVPLAQGWLAAKF